TYIVIGQLLAEELSIAGNGKKASLQLTTAAKVEHIQQSMTILDQGIGREKVLVYMSNEGDTPEEVILTIQGYLLKAKMPPITHESEWEQEHIVLDFHNQYLTLREKALEGNIIDIPKDVDPFGILQKHVTNGVFTTDSIVQCFQRTKADGPSQKMQYKKSHLTTISVGQLVEIQTSFVAVPRGKGKYKLVCKLRSVCILDQSIEQELNRECVQQALRSASPMRKVKWNVNYDDDDSDVEETRKDVKCMWVDNGAD
ncbi:hypothetical protein FOMPIDRAFT_65033, partial [Fomitopsis schrenkii]